MSKITKAEMIEAIMEAAGTDEDFLWNQAIDIAEVMDIIRKRLQKQKKDEMKILYEKAIVASKKWDSI